MSHLSSNSMVIATKINFTNSKTLVGRSVSRPTVTRVTFDLPETKDLFFLEKKRNEKKRK